MNSPDRLSGTPQHPCGVGTEQAVQSRQQRAFCKLEALEVVAHEEGHLGLVPADQQRNMRGQWRGIRRKWVPRLQLRIQHRGEAGKVRAIAGRELLLHLVVRREHLRDGQFLQLAQLRWTDGQFLQHPL